MYLIIAVSEVKEVVLEDLVPLKDRWLELYPNFSDFREALLATVARWEWSNGPRYDPRPFYFQRIISRGRILRVYSTDNENHFGGNYRVGYDKNNRVIVSQSDYRWETFYSFSENKIEILISKGDILRGISILNFHYRLPSKYFSFTLGGDPEAFNKSANTIWEEATQGIIQIYAEREYYRYDESKITEINLTRWHNSFNIGIGTQEGEANLIYHLNYDVKGSLSQITSRVLPYDYVQIVYRKRQVGETLDSLAKNAQTKLVANIPKLISKAKFAEPLYCLQLRFSDTHFFPPTLLPGFESRRQRLLKEMGKPYAPNEIWAQVWDPDEHDIDDPYTPYPIEDDETLEACERLQIEVGVRRNKARSDFGLRSLRQVAKTLNKLDWSKYAPVTEDFIVFAYDQESLGMALHLSGASPDQISSWRKRGLL